MYYDLKKDQYIEGSTKKGLSFMYNSLLGRIMLRLFITKLMANLSRMYMNSWFSKWRIKKFIKKNNINMEEYEDTKYRSFNEFFMRSIKPGKRKISKGLYAISDAKLTVYKIDKNTKLNIKDSIYTIDELIGEKKQYKYALVFRLCVDDYHHYLFPDSGKIVKSKYIKGKFHTVQPIALKKYKVFKENAREVTFLDCDHLGDVCYIEVGAMMVGRIVNEPVEEFSVGQEKGHFEFGGSTIILLINKDIKFNEKILQCSEDDIETIVKMGEKLDI